MTKKGIKTYLKPQLLLLNVEPAVVSGCHSIVVSGVVVELVVALLSLALSLSSVWWWLL